MIHGFNYLNNSGKMFQRIIIPLVLVAGFLCSTLLLAEDTHLLDRAMITTQSPTHPSLEIRFAPGKEIATSDFWSAYKYTFGLSDEYQFQRFHSYRDHLGQVHHRYKQFYKGIELRDVQFVLHEQAGKVFYGNGYIVRGLDIEVTPFITEKQALENALNFIGAEEYMWESPQREAFLKKEQNDPDASFFPQGRLVLTSGSAPLTAPNFRLAYEFDVYSYQPFGRYYVFVDARTGEVFYTLNRIHTGDVPGTGQSMYNGMVDIIIDSFVGGYRLREAARGSGIQTFDMQNSTNYSTAVDFVDGDTNFTDPNAEAGVSAHWGAEATYDFYMNTFNRNSYDDAGGILLSYVHYGSSFNNAFWDGTRMTYGDGDGITFTPLVSLDVCGHELTHGVTQFSAGLIYQAESGALNESFSDIFGTMVEYYKEGSNFDWYIGEDITPNGNGIRSMSNPNEFGDPDTYFGDFWASLTGGDNGGVHTNSGVQNFWFYLLSEGGSGVNDNGDPYNVTGIGIDNAAAIAYRNLTVYLTPASPYFDARLGAINSAIDLFGANSPEVQAVKDAWDAVGVYYPRFGATVATTPRRLEFLAETSVSSDTARLDIYNMGLQPLVINDIQVPGDYQVLLSANLPLVLSDFQDSTSISVVFTPTQPGENVDSLIIISNDTINPQFPVVLDGFGFMVNPAQEGVLYGVTTGQSNSQFVSLNTQTGEGTMIGLTGIEDMKGMAVHPITGIIYGTVNNTAGSTYLVRINAAQGDAYISGEMPQFNLRAITFDRDGNMYAARFNNGELFEVDLATGNLTSIGLTGIPLLSGLAVNPLNGELWGISLVNKVYKIDKLTGNSTLIGEPGFNRTPDIVFDDQGHLFGLAGGEDEVSTLIEIDTTTGVGTAIGSTGITGLSGLAIKTTPIVGIEGTEPIPQSFELMQNFPNPFNPVTTITFTIPQSSRVTLQVFDITGQLVRTLVKGNLEPGKHEVLWDGKDDSSNLVSSGVYLYRLSTSSFVKTRKMILLK